MSEPAALDVRAVITCPACGTATEETIPGDACLFFWACPSCTALVRSQEGDCCVFCSYGTRRCPTSSAH